MKDKKIMRYAPYPRGHRAFFTQIINLSETGMAFTVPFLDSPQLNEIMMVEFTVPGSEPMACFAQVQRVQKYTLIESDFFQKDCKLVAVKFTQIKPEQIKVLKLSLQDEFKKINIHFRRQQFFLKLKWYWKFKRSLMIGGFAASIFLTSALLWTLF
ncbi:PilZ domain-containing protein [bacterium]|nr:PilZ domain-containing protein [bacterium]